MVKEADLVSLQIRISAFRTARFLILVFSLRRKARFERFIYPDTTHTTKLHHRSER